MKSCKYLNTVKLRNSNLKKKTHKDSYLVIQSSKSIFFFKLCQSLSQLMYAPIRFFSVYIYCYYPIQSMIALLAAVRRPEISNLHRHNPLREPIHTLVRWSLGDLFFCALRNSCQASVGIRTTNFSICSQARYDWTNVPKKVYFDIFRQRFRLHYSVCISELFTATAILT